jgi:hypothetical protein
MLSIPPFDHIPPDGSLRVVLLKESSCSTHYAARAGFDCNTYWNQCGYTGERPVTECGYGIVQGCLP